MVNVKCVFPRNYYLLRKVNIKVGKKLIGKVGHNEIIKLSTNENTLRFRIDYHRFKIEVPDEREDVFLILYLGFRNYFPFYITDVMFKNSLRVKAVDEREFNDFNVTFYETSHSEPLKLSFAKIYTVIIGMIISSGFIYSPFFIQDRNSDSPENFAFYIGIANIIGFLLILINRRKMVEHQYKVRIYAFFILSVLLLIYMNIIVEIKLIAIALSLSMLILTMRTEFRKIFKSLMFF